MNFKLAKVFVLEKLRNELSKDLTYHSVEHTLDVMKSSRRLGEMEGLELKQMCLLETAALYHDIGFTDVYDGHEEASVQIAKETLPGFGYSQEDIQTITALIRATEYPQNPQNLLECIMVDSDLDSIGRNDMFTLGQRLQDEWSRFGNTLSSREWYELEIEFLKNHRYFTKSAFQLREAGKQENIQAFEVLLRVEQSGES